MLEPPTGAPVVRWQQDIDVSPSPSVFSAHERRTLGVEDPPWNQKLHRNGVVARTESHAGVTPMCQLNLCHIDFNAQPWTLGDCDRAFDNLERFFGEALAVLPDPMGVDRRDLPRCSSRDVRK